MNYEEWYTEVDRVVIGIAGVGIDDLPDGCSWDAWHDGTSPVEYAREQLETVEGVEF